MAKDVIVLEFNELTPSLVSRFIAFGDLPNFRRLRDRSLVATTDAGEQHPNLEPWIQWVTVHTGLSYAQHGVFNLGDGPKLRAPRIWDMVSAAGKKVWICGSMNAAVQTETINGFVLPDPWAVDIGSKPEGLFAPYLDLVRTYVQEYTTAKPKVTKSAFANFGRFMVANGLSVKTVTDTIRQLARERRDQSHWRRAAILDRLQWDIFRSFYRKERPAFSTFFLNSTAHYQHYFWRNMDPADFAMQSDAATQKKYEDAIPFGYRKMDEIIGECLALAGPETSIVLCTALSQQPMLDYEDSGGKQIFKPHDQKALFDFAGVDVQYEYAPVMAEQFHLLFANEADAIAAQAKIAALKLADGTQLMLAKREGDRIFSGCCLTSHPAAGMDVVAADGKAMPFLKLFYPVEAVRSGMHHPDGMLWIMKPGLQPRILDRRIALTEIAPTLLQLAGAQTDHVFADPAIAEIQEAPVAMPRREPVFA